LMASLRAALSSSCCFSSASSIDTSVGAPRGRLGANCLLGLREAFQGVHKASPKVAKRAGHLHMLGSQRTLLNAQRAIVELDCLTASFPRRCSAQQVASRKSEPSASRASCRRPSQHGPKPCSLRGGAPPTGKAAPRHRNVSAAAARLLTRLLRVAEGRHTVLATSL
jgi:hypothetical protein